jgi:hypothetical protein
LRDHVAHADPSSQYVKVLSAGWEGGLREIDDG